MKYLFPLALFFFVGCMTTIKPPTYPNKLKMDHSLSMYYYESDPLPKGTVDDFIRWVQWEFPESHGVIQEKNGEARVMVRQTFATAYGQTYLPDPADLEFSIRFSENGGKPILRFQNTLLYRYGYYQTWENLENQKVKTQTTGAFGIGAVKTPKPETYFDNASGLLCTVFEGQVKRFGRWLVECE